MVTSQGPSSQVLDRGTMMNERDDIFLLKAIADARDDTAFSELCSRYERRAFNTAYRILKDSALAEDAVQEAMLSIWQRSPTANQPSGNTTDWILRIVSNKSLHLRRSQKYKVRRESGVSIEPCKSQVSLAKNPEGDELIAMLRTHVDQLPELECALLTCCYGANMSHQKIAEVLGIPRRTITDKIQQALKHLRANLTKAGAAAVVPLLCRENLYEAMTTGHECPPGMTARIMSRMVDSAGSKAMKALSRRAIAVKPAGWIPFAAGMMVLAAAGGLWWASSTPQVNSVPVTESANPPVNRTWDFNNAELPKDTTVTEGDWHWVAKNGPDGSGCMETTAPLTTVVLDLPIRRLPILVSMRVREKPGFDPAKHGTWGSVHWTEDDGFADFHNVSAMFNKRGQWTECSFFVTDKLIGSMWRPGNEPLHIFYTSRRAGAKLALSFANVAHQVDDVKIREIPPEQVPDFSAYINAVEKIELSKRVGEVPVPELKSARPPKPVIIEFFPPTGTAGRR